MSEKTMLDVAGQAVLEGDPLGLRELEESLAWRRDGALPDWLEGAEDDEDGFFAVPPKAPPRALNVQVFSVDAHPVLEFADAPPVETPPLPPTMIVASPYNSPSSVNPRVTTAASSAPLEPAPPISDILHFIDDPAEAPSAKASCPPVAVPTRRALTFEELIDARLCLLTEVAGRLWAIPLDRIVAVAHAREAGHVVDLHERFEGKRRRRNGNAVTLDTETVLLVDRILGPRSLVWETLLADSGAPVWELARTTIANEIVGLLDVEAL